MALLSLLLLPAPSFAGPDGDFFESKVRPLLLARCVGCHGPEKSRGGLRLDSRAGWAAGGDSGPAVVPGKPDESLLIKAVRYLDKDLQMPPNKALTPQEVEVLTRWVKDGAFDPRKEASAAPKVSASWEREFKKRLDWWSLKPLAARRGAEGFRRRVGAGPDRPLHQGRPGRREVEAGTSRGAGGAVASAVVRPHRAAAQRPSCGNAS